MAHIFVLKMLTVTSLELVEKNAVATVGIRCLSKAIEMFVDEGMKQNYH